MEKENKPKKKSNKFLILIIVLAVLIYLIPSLFLMGAIAYDILDTTEYVEKDDSIIIENGKVTLTNLNGYYDKETNEYYIYGYINKPKKDYTLDLVFDVYDANGYIIGQAETTIEIEKDENYKFKAIYYETDASEIVNYKINCINLY